MTKGNQNNSAGTYPQASPMMNPSQQRQVPGLGTPQSQGTQQKTQKKLGVQAGTPNRQTRTNYPQSAGTQTNPAWRRR